VYNRPCIERSSKKGFWGDFGVGAKIFGGKVHLSSELRVFGPDLTRCVVAFYMGIAICHRRKFGQIWVSPAQVAGKQRDRKAPLWTLDYHTEKS